MKKRPIELVNLSKACADAWAKRDAMIEAGDVVGVKAMNEACAIIDKMYNSVYRQWQILGGTSDIDSIAYPKTAIDYEHAEWLDNNRTMEDARY